MKIRAYDKYNKRQVTISFVDEVSLSRFGSHLAGGNVFINVESDDEDPDLNRWSDLEDIEVEI